MSVIERFQIAMHTDLGFVFIILLGLFVILLGVYYYLQFIQKKQDVSKYFNRSYYQKIDSLQKEFNYQGNHKAEFWGRQTVVRFSDGKIALCLIPPPDLADESMRKKIIRFKKAIDSQYFPAFAPYIWSQTNDSLILVQDNLLESNSKHLYSLKHYLADHEIQFKDKEVILEEIAKSLDKLHQLRTEDGESIYHGFLLPLSIFLEMDAKHEVKKVVIADSGLAFATNPDSFLKRLIHLRSGKLPIEKFAVIQLLEQISMLAPEQRQKAKLSQIGTAVDYFTFGALIVTLFTEKRFSDVKNVQWEKVPERWRDFAKNCLQDDPSERPTSLLPVLDASYSVK